MRLTEAASRRPPRFAAVCEEKSPRGPFAPTQMAKIYERLQDFHNFFTQVVQGSVSILKKAVFLEENILHFWQLIPCNDLEIS